MAVEEKLFGTFLPAHSCCGCIDKRTAIVIFIIFHGLAGLSNIITAIDYFSNPAIYEVNSFYIRGTILFLWGLLYFFLVYLGILARKDSSKAESYLKCWKIYYFIHMILYIIVVALYISYLNKFYYSKVTTFIIILSIVLIVNLLILLHFLSVVHSFALDCQKEKRNNNPMGNEMIPNQQQQFPQQQFPQQQFPQQQFPQQQFPQQQFPQQQFPQQQLPQQLYTQQQPYQNPPIN